MKFCNHATIARFVTILFSLLNMVDADARVKVEIISTQDKIAVVKIVGKIKSEEDLELKQELAKLHGTGYSLKLNAIVLDTGGGSGYCLGVLTGPLTWTMRPMLPSHPGKSPTTTARSPSLQRRFIVSSSTPKVWHQTSRGTPVQRFSSICESPCN
jgi:hypothetical protein